MTLLIIYICFVTVYFIGAAFTQKKKGSFRVLWPLQWLPEKKAVTIPTPTDVAVGLVNQALLAYPEKWVKKKVPGALCSEHLEFEHKNIKCTVKYYGYWHYTAMIGGIIVDANVAEGFDLYREREAAKRKYEREHAVLNAVEEYLK